MERSIWGDGESQFGKLKRVFGAVNKWFSHNCDRTMGQRCQTPSSVREDLQNDFTFTQKQSERKKRGKKNLFFFLSFLLFHGYTYLKSTPCRTCDLEPRSHEYQTQITFCAYWFLINYVIQSRFSGWICVILPRFHWLMWIAVQ